MKHCIPDELFNAVQLPIDGYEKTEDGITSADEVTIDDIYKEMAYKLPSAPELTAKREIWHTICDFCYRTGALLQRATSTSDVSSANVELDPIHNWEFIRVVACMSGTNNTPTNEITVPDSLVNGHYYVEFLNGSTSNNTVWFSVRPSFVGLTEINEGVEKWNPKIYRYIITKYGECIMHGSLMRIYAMSGRPWANTDLARMHGVAYNNDLNRISFGRITSGMRKHLLIDIEDFIVSSGQGQRQVPPQG